MSDDSISRKVEQSYKNIQEYIDKCKYTWSVESLLYEYKTKYLKGYYVSFTCKDCIENCKEEFEILKAGGA